MYALGLLLPCEMSEAGYRLYGTKELERLQQILLYRELDFTLEQIKHLLEGDPDRSSILSKKEELLNLRKQRLETIIETLRKSIISTEKGEHMDDKELFKGFESEEEWKEALKGQNEHLKETYDFDLLESVEINIQSMNDMASEAALFMTSMAEALQGGKAYGRENRTFTPQPS